LRPGKFEAFPQSGKKLRKKWCAEKQHPGNFAPREIKKAQAMKRKKKIKKNLKH